MKSNETKRSTNPSKPQGLNVDSQERLEAYRSPPNQLGNQFINAYAGIGNHRLHLGESRSNSQQNFIGYSPSQPQPSGERVFNAGAEDRQREGRYEQEQSQPGYTEDQSRTFHRSYSKLEKMLTKLSEISRSDEKNARNLSPEHIYQSTANSGHHSHRALQRSEARTGQWVSSRSQRDNRSPQQHHQEYAQMPVRSSGQQIFVQEKQMQNYPRQYQQYSESQLRTTLVGVLGLIGVQNPESCLLDNEATLERKVKGAIGSRLEDRLETNLNMKDSNISDEDSEGNLYSKENQIELKQRLANVLQLFGVQDPETTARFETEALERIIGSHLKEMGERQRKTQEEAEVLAKENSSLKSELKERQSILEKGKEKHEQEREGLLRAVEELQKKNFDLVHSNEIKLREVESQKAQEFHSVKIELASLQRQNQNLLEKISSLEVSNRENLKEKQNEIEEMKKDLKNKDEKFNEQLKKNDELRNDRDTKINELHEKINAQLSKTGEKDRELFEKDREADKVKNDLTKLADKLTALEEEHSKLLRQRKGDKHELGVTGGPLDRQELGKQDLKKEKEIQELRSELLVSQGREKSLAEQLENLKAQLKDKDKQLTQSQEDFKEQMRMHNVTLEVLARNVIEKESPSTARKEQLSEKSEPQTQDKASRKKEKQGESSVDTEGVGKQLKESKDLAKSLETKIEEMRAQEESRIKEKNREIDELRGKLHEKQDNHMAEIEAIKKQLSSSELTIKETQSLSKIELLGLQKQLEQKEVDLQALREKVSSLQSALKESQKVESQKLGEASSLRNQISDLERSMKGLELERVKLKADLTEKDNTHRALKLSAEGREAELELELERTRKELASKVAAALEEKSRSEEALAEYKRVSSELRADIESYQGKHLQTGYESKAEGREDSSSRQLSELERENRDLKEQNSKLSSGIEEKAKEIGRLVNQASLGKEQPKSGNSLEQQSDLSLEIINALKGELVKREKELRDLKEEQGTLERRVAELSRESQPKEKQTRTGKKGGKGEAAPEEDSKLQEVLKSLNLEKDSLLKAQKELEGKLAKEQSGRQQEVKAKEERLADLERRIEGLELEKKRLESAKGVLEQSVSKLEEEVKAGAMQHRELLKKIDEEKLSGKDNDLKLRAELALLRAERDEETRKSALVNKEAVQKIEELEDKLSKAINEHKKRSETLEGELRKAREEEKEKVSKGERELDSVKKEHKEAVTRVKKAESQVELLREEKEKEVRDLKRELEELKGQMKAETKKQGAEIEEKKKEIESIGLALKGKEEELKRRAELGTGSLSEKDELLLSQGNMLEKTSSDLLAARSQVGGLEARIKQLAEELSQAKGQAELQSMRGEQSEQRLQAVQEKLEKEKIDLQETIKGLEAKDEKRQLIAELEVAKESLKEVKRLHDTVTVRLGQVEKELIKVSGERDEAIFASKLKGPTEGQNNASSGAKEQRPNPESENRRKDLENRESAVKNKERELADLEISITKAKQQLSARQSETSSRPEVVDPPALNESKKVESLEQSLAQLQKKESEYLQQIERLKETIKERQKEARNGRRAAEGQGGQRYREPRANRREGPWTDRSSQQGGPTTQVLHKIASEEEKKTGLMKPIEGGKEDDWCASDDEPEAKNENTGVVYDRRYKPKENKAEFVKKSEVKAEKEGSEQKGQKQKGGQKRKEVQEYQKVGVESPAKVENKNFDGSQGNKGRPVTGKKDNREEYKSKVTNKQDGKNEREEHEMVEPIVKKVAQTTKTPQVVLKDTQTTAKPTTSFGFLDPSLIELEEDILVSIDVQPVELSTSSQVQPMTSTIDQKQSSNMEKNTGPSKKLKNKGNNKTAVSNQISESGTLNQPAQIQPKLVESILRDQENSIQEIVAKSELNSSPNANEQNSPLKPVEGSGRSSLLESPENLRSEESRESPLTEKPGKKGNTPAVIDSSQFKGLNLQELMSMGEIDAPKASKKKKNKKGKGETGRQAIDSSTNLFSQRSNLEQKTETRVQEDESSDGSWIEAGSKMTQVKVSSSQKKSSQASNLKNSGQVDEEIDILQNYQAPKPFIVKSEETQKPEQIKTESSKPKQETVKTNERNGDKPKLVTESPEKKRKGTYGKSGEEQYEKKKEPNAKKDGSGGASGHEGKDATRSSNQGKKSHQVQSEEYVKVEKNTTKEGVKNDEYEVKPAQPKQEEVAVSNKEESVQRKQFIKESDVKEQAPIQQPSPPEKQPKEEKPKETLKKTEKAAPKANEKKQIEEQIIEKPKIEFVSSFGKFAEEMNSDKEDVDSFDTPMTGDGINSSTKDAKDEKKPKNKKKNKKKGEISGL
jgi:hypothetical protein